ELIDVTVRLIVEHAFAEPHDGAHAEILAKHALDLRAREFRIAVLVEQTLFGDERGARAIDGNGTAFIDDLRGVAVATFDLENLARDEFVLRPRGVEAAVIAAPRVETPVHAPHVAGFVHDERRARVARPAIIVRHLDDADMRGQRFARTRVMRG